MPGFRSLAGFGGRKQHGFCSTCAELVFGGHRGSPEARDAVCADVWCRAPPVLPARCARRL